MSLRLLLPLLVSAALAQHQPSRDRARNPARNYVPQQPHPCERSSCYPATGNLIIGRENKLYASSTCGTRRQEKYCIVSHLEERKKCFWCDSRPQTENNPLLNHRVQNIIYRFQPGTRLKSWWQSENGKENVTIQLDLEAEFHFTHLIIVFKTFRPAAMLVERSFDFGKTWRVYRYFAHNCDEAFPNVPKHSPTILTDVVCESRYSGVAPSTDGEIIFRVLPPNINVDNPYSQEVQNLLKMTNFRINFTKLHTLGDDLLDNRAEIQEKYYYAITDMAVRGSCSCYGHASRCLPLPGVESKTDMVHGRCECTHNTKGLNCEFCEDFYNDWPWKPAVGKTTNTCKRCTCNNHATSCHFDTAVYESTGKVSGGVCDDCMHNTMGRNCELCKSYFYQDPNLDIQNPEVCKPCDCDPRGSLDSGICDAITDIDTNQEAGSCHCKKNVAGRRCDNCKDGFWNFDENNLDGCDACTCDPLGTLGTGGCDFNTGVCTCKRHVMGRNCNQCLPEFYGLSESDEGCSPCDCNIGGSLDNDCDVITGQCRCRPNVQGRSCDQPTQHSFAPSLDFLVYEAELSECNSDLDPNAINNNCKVVIKEPFRDGKEETWTGTGFMKVSEDDNLKFLIDNIYTTMDYDLQIRYEPSQVHGDWQEVTIFVERPGNIDYKSVCANYNPAHDTQTVTLTDNTRSVFLETAICLEAGKAYDVKIVFGKQNRVSSNSRASILIDSIALIPKFDALPFFSNNSRIANYRRREFEENDCGNPYYLGLHKENVPEICKKYHMSIGFYIIDGAKACRCDPTGSVSHKCDEYGGQCPCKANVVGRSCNRCAPGTYGFSPEGCKSCDCNSIGALDNFCDVASGQCKCRPNTYGRQCDQCQPGYWNFPNCVRCDCNGHADVCDAHTGACINCRDNTEGHRCERCIESYYGDPRLGTDIACRPCPCPGTEASGHSFAKRCNLDEFTKDVVCECEEGYAGPRCDVCADNYYGHPEEPGGSCRACDCNHNVDLTKPGNCDHHTGQCLQCLYDTEGDNCEICRAGYSGDALAQTCVRCECSPLGTNVTKGECNRSTGQCPCYPYVQGLNCDRCTSNHWRIASGQGCDPCDCDSTGSVDTQCHEYLGDCTCRTGFGGRQCDQCQTYFWGNPTIECYLCNCNEEGSLSQQCLRDNGTCVCRPGIGGEKCDRCARGYLGISPQCEGCGECFNNWDRIIGELGDQTNRIINEASQINVVGATGAYTRDFDEMDKKIHEIQSLLNNTSVGKKEAHALRENVDNLKIQLSSSDKKVQDMNDLLANVTTNINLGKASLDKLRDDTKKLEDHSNALDYNATKLQEANLEGALNLTREAKQRAIKAADDADASQRIIAETERQIKGTDLLVERQYASFNNTQNENDQLLMDLQDKLNDLESHIPDLNDNMCGQASDACDICGGAGCGKCGGISCERGAVTKADQALDFANKTEQRIKEHELMADDQLRSISQAKLDTEMAFDKCEQTYLAAEEIKNMAQSMANESNSLSLQLKDFLSNWTTTPADVRLLAKQILNMSISLQPEQITDLAREINNTVSQLTNIDSIIEATRADLDRAKEIQHEATVSKENANHTLETATKVLSALEEAKVAQKAAEKAIRDANNDIQAARTDLAPIASETDEAQRKANDTMEEVENLRIRLGNLQKSILKIENDAQQVKDEAEAVVITAESAQQEARELRQKYQNANTSLANRADQSSNSRERAQLLLKRATQLAADTQMQLKELQNMEDLYNSHTAQLGSLESRIKDLNAKMAIYLAEITVRSDSYRSCTT